MDSLDTCVKLEMTKIRSRAGPNGVSHLERTHFFVNYSFTFVIDWCAPLKFGVLFRGVAIAAAMRSHQSGSGER